MTIAEMCPDGVWRKSRRSNVGNWCVEVRWTASGVEVRDSKDPSGPVVSYDEAAWRRFVASVRGGAFDSGTPDTPGPVHAGRRLAASARTAA